MDLLWALLGLLIGALLNLAIDRLPRDERLISPIRCPRCMAPRPLYAQFSLLSLLLGERGGCRACGARPDRMAVAVEVATGLAFWLLFLRFGPGPRLLLYSFYSCILVVVFFIDMEHRRILNRVTYPGIALSTLMTATMTPVGLEMTLAGAAAAGGLLGAVYGLGRLLFRKEVLGLGDVKLSVLLGAMAGFPAVVWWLFLGSLFGAAGGLALVVARRYSLHDFMPYGTAMCLGAFVALFLDGSPLL